MLLGQLEGLAPWLAQSPVGNDRIWKRPLADLAEEEIQMFYARSSAGRMRDAAIEAIDRAQAAVIAAACEGQIRSGESSVLILHEVPIPRFMADDLVLGLVKLRPARRPAVLFALETLLEPKDVMTLTWSQLAARGLQLSQLCKDILATASRTRHIRLPYVFWERAGQNVDAPLLGLEDDAKQAFGCSWATLQARYTSMIMLDRHAEATSFLSLVEDVTAGRI